MNQLTIRNVDEGLLSKIKILARQEGVSMNKFVVKLLRESLGFDKKQKIPGLVKHHDLDYLFGTWSEEEAQEFDEALNEHRKIDGELWS